MNNIEILTFDTKKQKKVLAGLYNPEKKTFYKNVSAGHWMNIHKGFGISVEVMDDLKTRGCYWIVVVFGNEIRKVLFDIWNNKSADTYGHGKQKFMPWDGMSVVNSDQQELFKD